MYLSQTLLHPLLEKLNVRLCAYSFTIQYIKTKNRASSRLLFKNRVALKKRASSRLLAKNRASQVFWDPNKNRASSRLLVKNRVSQVFWEPIKNRVSPRSVLLEAVYLEALLYIKSIPVSQSVSKFGYSKASRYTALRSADLGDTRFLIGSQNT